VCHIDWTWTSHSSVSASSWTSFTFDSRQFGHTKHKQLTHIAPSEPFLFHTPESDDVYSHKIALGPLIAISHFLRQPFAQPKMFYKRGTYLVSLPLSSSSPTYSNTSCTFQTSRSHQTSQFRDPECPPRGRVTRLAPVILMCASKSPAAAGPSVTHHGIQHRGSVHCHRKTLSPRSYIAQHIA
jgi:hypothetical protein